MKRLTTRTEECKYCSAPATTEIVREYTGHLRLYPASTISGPVRELSADQRTATWRYPACEPCASLLTFEQPRTSSLTELVTRRV